MVAFVFIHHARLALDAALLFAVGLFAAWPVIHYRWRAPAAPALAIVGALMALIRRRPTIARTAAIIFAFNGLAIFAYMATGFHPMLPKLIAVWTGFNVAAVVGLTRDEPWTDWPEAPAGWWRPSRLLAALCALAVLVLELPCFWLSVAMGISMGHAVQSGVQSYGAALAERAVPYAAILLPLLLASAVAETVAMRAGHRPAQE